MHTVELLEEAIVIAKSLGYGIRHEYLGGIAGGHCEIGGAKWLFIDLALNPIEQLEQITDSLRDCPGIHLVSKSSEMGQLLGIRQSA